MSKIHLRRVPLVLALTALSCASPSRPIESPHSARPKVAPAQSPARTELLPPLEGIRIEARVARARAGATFSSDGRFLLQGPLVREVVSGDVDTIVLFIAGHGVHDRDAGATYYYLPHDVNPKDLAHTAIPFDALEDALASSPARTRVLLMDTCQSGEAEEDARAVVGLTGARVRGARGLVLSSGPRRNVVEKDRYAYVDLVRRAGAIVVSSSHGGEPSLENDTLGHGLFTSALLDALKGRAADADKSGTLSREELFSFVRASVTSASGGTQNPTIDRDNLAVDLDLPVGR